MKNYLSSKGGNLFFPGHLKVLDLSRFFCLLKLLENYLDGKAERSRRQDWALIFSNLFRWNATELVDWKNQWNSYLLGRFLACCTKMCLWTGGKLHWFPALLQLWCGQGWMVTFYCLLFTILFLLKVNKENIQALAHL